MKKIVIRILFLFLVIPHIISFCFCCNDTNLEEKHNKPKMRVVDKKKQSLAPSFTKEELENIIKSAQPQQVLEIIRIDQKSDVLYYKKK